nr:hypothetical protein [uncultured Hyphomonas sp.]
MSENSIDPNKLYICSFCGADQHERRYVVVNTDDKSGITSSICNECMDISVDAVTDAAKKSGYVVHKIERTLEFRPEHKQAGISILNYFSEVLNKRYPENDAKIKISQKGNLVSLIVETTNGDVETIEAELQMYGEIIEGSQPLPGYFKNDLDTLELKNKLEIAKMEIRMTREMLEYSKTSSSERIDSLESQVKSLQKLIGSSIKVNHSLSNQIGRLIDSKSIPQEVAIELGRIQELAEGGLTEANEAEVKASIRSIQSKDESVLHKLANLSGAAAVGASGNLLATWILQVLSSV